MSEAGGNDLTIYTDPSEKVKTIRPKSLWKAIYVVMISFAVVFGPHVLLLDYYFM